MVKHTQTILGPLWFVIQPVALSIVLLLAVNKGAGVATEGVPPFLFNMCSLAPWFYFSQTFHTVATTFMSNVGLFRKVYFPRLAVPVAVALSNLVPLALQVIVFLFSMVAYRLAGYPVGTGWHLALLPVVFVQLVVFSLGMGLIAAALTAHYRDLAHALQYVVLLIMFGSLVFVPASSLPADMRWITWMNPLAVIMESTRAAALGTAGIPAIQLAVSWAFTALVAVVGVLVFDRATRTAIDKS